MRRLKMTTAVAAASLVALAGCSVDGGFKSSSEGSEKGSETRSEQIPGDAVAAKAEVALNAEVDTLAEGGFECPDIDRETGATGTCLRSSEAGGYYLTIEGAIEITDVEGDDFGLHVTMDDVPQTFGTTGEAIAKDLSTQAETRLGEAPSQIECPDLEGEDGTTITCAMTVKGDEKQIEVTATEVDVPNFTMSYTFREL